MTLTRISAPFTQDAVQALNEYQTDTANARPMHPFTCGNRGDGNHGSEGGDKGILIATFDGWVCPYCDYTQDWAHGFMADSTRAFSPHPWEKLTDAERVQAKLKRVIELRGEYQALFDRNPSSAGPLIMLACLDTRGAQLQREMESKGAEC